MAIAIPILDMTQPHTSHYWKSRASELLPTLLPTVLLFGKVNHYIIHKVVIIVNLTMLHLHNTTNRRV